MNEIACHQCGTVVLKYPSQVYTHTFCSRACLGAWRSTQTGPKAPHWKGGMRHDRHRVEIHMPWHHRAGAAGYVLRSIVVAELTLRRPLLPEEVVHHIDDDSSNDHPDNLHVYANQSEHARHHGLQRTVPQMATMRAARTSP